MFNHWFYLFAFLILYLIFSLTHNISERFNKGKIIRSAIIRKILWIRKSEVYISYPSLVFVIFGYIYLIALIPCNIICFFVSNYFAIWITAVYFTVISLTLLIESMFLPFYGAKG